MATSEISLRLERWARKMQDDVDAYKEFDYISLSRAEVLSLINDLWIGSAEIDGLINGGV